MVTIKSTNGLNPEYPKQISDSILGIKLLQPQFQSFDLYFQKAISEDDEAIKALSKNIIRQEFHETFKPKKKIGKGAFASVYLAARISDGKHFAIKAFSKKDLNNQKKGLSALMNEIDILKKLDHQFILQMQGVYESENSIYLALELIKGCNLE